MKQIYILFQIPRMLPGFGDSMFQQDGLDRSWQFD